MGLSYLNGLSWADITREERFFCQHLYVRVKDVGVGALVRYMNESLGTALQTDANWEVAYEACFYRDLWHHRGRGDSLFSPKRTFDLCLFSDSAIVIIEAKANQKFEHEQARSFAEDQMEVRALTNVDRVLLVGLASSLYTVPKEIEAVFDGGILRWDGLSRFFDNDPLMLKADATYGAVKGHGRNDSDVYLRGDQLLEAHRGGEEFVVGRSGGLIGRLLKHDLESGEWRTHPYRTDQSTTDPRNRNWFRLSDFAKLVERRG